MLGLGLQAHEVDDVDDAHAQVGQVLPQDGGGGDRQQPDEPDEPDLPFDVP
jgi:hypothetical protein